MNKPVKNFEGVYEVSDCGDVFRILEDGTLRPLKPLHINGYLRVILCYKKLKRHVGIHRLVAEAFLGDIEGMTIDHVDCNKHNNFVHNLEAVSQSENSKRAWANNLMKTRGTDNGCCVLPEWKVLQAVRLRGYGIKYRLIAGELGMNMTTLSAILRGQSWSWLTGVPRSNR